MSVSVNYLVYCADPYWIAQQFCLSFHNHVSMGASTRCSRGVNRPV